MKFSLVLAFVAAATVVSAESNGLRFARGLGPNQAKRGTKTDSGHGHKPSSTPGSSQCSNNKQYCCEQTAKHDGNNDISSWISALGLNVPAGALVGSGCSVITANSCSQQSVCCNNVYQNGEITWGCSPVSL